MTVLVTGGAGYIGSHTVRHLRSEGYDVVVYDSLHRGRTESLLGAELVVGDIRDRSLVARTCREYSVDAVIHFAALKSVGESMVTPDIYWSNNVQGTVELIEGMIEGIADPEARRLVFSSSAAVYGSPSRLPITENADIRPENVYAETKATMERMISWYGITHDLKWTSLRYFNAAGASSDSVLGEDWSQTTNLIPLVMKAALGAGPEVHVFGTNFATVDGSGVRDYVHVEDLARAHQMAVDHLCRGGDNLTLNLGTGRGTSVLQILHETARVAGKQVPHVVTGRRTGDPAEVFADVRLARNLLDWEAQRSLADIIESAYRWHSSQMP